jgi:hypothetical protein
VTTIGPDAGAEDAGVVDAASPWPGLVAFREGDARFFRGRDAEIETLVRLVRRERVTILRGVSGLGKSSLIQAGLFPKLGEELFLRVYLRLSYASDAVPLRQQVLDALAHEAAATGVEAPSVDPGQTLWEHFHRRDVAYWSADNRPVTPVLVFDQFEEVFTHGREGDNAAQTSSFLGELGDLVEGRVPAALKVHIDAGGADPREYVFDRHPYKVIIGIRDDFMGELKTLIRTANAPSLAAADVLLRPFSGAAALAVTAAGNQNGATIVPPAEGERLVRLIANESSGTADLTDLVVEPAILSLFLHELNAQRLTEGQSSISLTNERSRDTILETFYDRSFDHLNPAVQHFVEDKLLTEDGKFRDSEALENALAFPGITAAALNALVERRLIRRDERGGRTRIELTHDVLTPIVRRRREARQAEQRAAAERVRADELERQGARARRRNYVLMAFGAVCLALAAITGISARAAAGARDRAASSLERAQHDRATMLIALTSAESARRHADSLAGALADTVDAMHVAQSAATTNEREALVQGEVADEYLRMAGRIPAWIRGQQLALDATALRTIHAADTIRARDELMMATLAPVICTKSRDAAGDTTALARLRSQFRQAGLFSDSSCVNANASVATPTP